MTTNCNCSLTPELFIEPTLDPVPLLKHFQISCAVFWGFNRNIDISRYNSIKDCVDKFLDVHKEFLFEQNYVDLLIFFEKHRSDYHIHNMNIEDLKNTDSTIYVCRHSGTNEIINK